MLLITVPLLPQVSLQFRALRSMDVKQSNSFVFVQNFAFYGCQTVIFCCFCSELCVLWISISHIFLSPFRTLCSMDVTQSYCFVSVQNFAFYGCQTVTFFCFRSELCVLWMSNSHIFLFPFRTLRSMDFKQSYCFVSVQNFAFYGCQTVILFCFSSERSVLWMSNSPIL